MMKKIIIVLIHLCCFFTVLSEEVNKKIGHYLQINDISIIKNTDNIVTVGHDEKIIIWDLDKDKIILEKEITNGDPFTACEVINNGERIIAGTEYGEIWVFDNKLKKIKSFNIHEMEITEILGAGQKNTIISASKDGTLKVINIENESVIKVHNLKNPILSIAFSAKKKVIAVGDDKGIIYLIDLNNSFNVINIVRNKEKEPILGISFSENSRYFVSISGKNKVKVFSTRLGEEICSYSIKGVKRLTTVNWNGSSNLISVGTKDNIYFFKADLKITAKQLIEEKILRNEIELSKKILFTGSNLMLIISEDSFLRKWNIYENKLESSFSSF